MLIQDGSAATLKHASSYSVQKWTDENGVDHVQEQEFLRCVHCQVHFPHRPGSGVWHERGYCKKCNGYLCGSPLCMKECLPWEMRLDYGDGEKVASVRKYIDIIRALEAEGYVIE